MKTIKVVLLAAALGIAGASGFVYLGVYNIGADVPHWRITHRAIETLRERSIASRAKDIEVPALDDAKMIAEGAEHYRAMCAVCHLAPGVGGSEFRVGLYPLPPNLAEHAHETRSSDDVERDAARQFWIIKHGIKMTSMPAAGKTHDDDTIWGIVAFLGALPEMSPEEYARLGSSESGHEHADGETHEHGGPPAGQAEEHADEHSGRASDDEHTELGTAAPEDSAGATVEMPAEHEDAPNAPPHDHQDAEAGHH